ncbi:hypothetical protein RFI_08775 [Reticulomyxa filosa]|uniref:Uncharacterized protein n=1 Tax=Reticulomyxa filosa TaxID=46433 RepID=X6NQS5_RETFI|nr:hypothetical protein RFI_08775 [Reticulomyxa filosa]|eukprot:ETO28356.1 hypothetical protein RFI_08775 [Reticulomyxa filosa]
MSTEQQFNGITLLSFGSSWDEKNKYTLVMKYVSVWGDDNDNINDNKINKSKKLKESNNNYPIIIGRDYDNYFGARADNNINIFDLNTFQFIKHDTLPTNNSIWFHCFVSKEKEQEKNLKIYETLLFCYDTWLLIE